MTASRTTRAHQVVRYCAHLAATAGPDDVDAQKKLAAVRAIKSESDFLEICAGGEPESDAEDRWPPGWDHSEGEFLRWVGVFLEKWAAEWNDDPARAPPLRLKSAPPSPTGTMIARALDVQRRPHRQESEHMGEHDVFTLGIRNPAVTPSALDNHAQPVGITAARPSLKLFQDPPPRAKAPTTTRGKRRLRAEPVLQHGVPLSSGADRLDSGIPQHKQQKLNTLRPRHEGSFPGQKSDKSRSGLGAPKRPIESPASVDTTSRQPHAKENSPSLRFAGRPLPARKQATLPASDSLPSDEEGQFLQWYRTVYRPIKKAARAQGEN